MSVRGLLGHLDKEIQVSVTGIESLRPVKLRIVEEYGIWVESDALVQLLVSAQGYAPGAQKVVFLPFTQIRFVLGGGELEQAADNRFGRRAMAAPANGH